MVRREKTKAAALALTVVCIGCAIYAALNGLPVEKVALCAGCSLLARLSYSFFHASLLHLLTNCWSLLAIVFIYQVSFAGLLVAYIVAVTAPVSLCGFAIATTPTVGLSAVVFCLLGIVSWQSKRKLYFHFWIASFIAVGFLLPHLCVACGFAIATPNNFLHLYCYVVGLLVGFLNAPAPWQRK